MWNKLDLLDAGRMASTVNSAQRRGGNARPILVSALTGQGEGALLTEVEDRLAEGRAVVEVRVAPTDGQGLHWLYEHGDADPGRAGCGTSARKGRCGLRKSRCDAVVRHPAADGTAR